MRCTGRLWRALLLTTMLSCDSARQAEPDPEDSEPAPVGATSDAEARDASSAALPDGSPEGGVSLPPRVDGGQARDAADDASSSTRDDASLPVGADAGELSGDGGAPTEPLPASALAAGVTSLFPAAGGRDLCTDPPLRIAFSGAPTLGTAGKIQVFDAAEPRTPVAVVDLAAKSVSDVRGGVSFVMQRPAYVDGNAALFYLPSRALRNGARYFVRVDKGTVRGPNGSELAIGDETSWTFSTAPNAPSSSTPLKVAIDGSGAFCSLQSAVDAAGNGARIELGRGTYHGIVYFRAKRDLTIRGADRQATVLAGTNNETMNGGTAKRALIGVDASSGISFENLTIHNLTPQGGSQAEALRMQTCDRCSVRDANIISLQDTLLWSGRVYAKNCYIAGNVDFIWGTGAAYFDQCEIKTLGRKGYNVQARNGASGYGYVFVDSKLTSDPGITGNWLARVDAAEYPASHVAYIDCELGKHIDPAGWQVTGATGSSLRFWEYRSKDASGALVDVSRRLSVSTQLSESQAAMMRDPSVVLGGWSPE